MADLRWTSQDLEWLPNDGKRYEIIDGELYISRHPHYYHQRACSRIFALLEDWSSQTETGWPVFAPGLIFAEDNDVVPDVAWISRKRLATALQPDGKLHSAPELVVEVLSPGEPNERRDREVKRKLYSQMDVLEYWIVNWQARLVEIYQREDDVLKIHSTLYESDILRSPHLPGFSCHVSQIFVGIR